LPASTSDDRNSGVIEGSFARRILEGSNGAKEHEVQGEEKSGVMR
jgi:hypothetical protein